MTRGDKRAPDAPRTNKHGAGGTKPSKPMMTDEMAEAMKDMPMRKPNRRRPK